MKTKTDPPLEFQNLDEVAEFISTPTNRESKHFRLIAEALADWAAGELGRDPDKEQTEELGAIGELIAEAMVRQHVWDRKDWSRWFDEPPFGYGDDLEQLLAEQHG